jgi:hypothetical protein
MYIIARVYFKWICKSQTRMRNFALLMAFGAIVKMAITVYALQLPNGVLPQ